MHRSNAEYRMIIVEMATNKIRSWGRGQRARKSITVVSNPKYNTLAIEVKLFRKQHEEDTHALLQDNAVQGQAMDPSHVQDVNYMHQRN